MTMGKGTDIHEDFDRSETIKPGSDRDFGLVFAASLSCCHYRPVGRPATAGPGGSIRPLSR